MSIEFTLQTNEDVLEVKAIGRDDNLDQVKEYGQAVIEEAIKNDCIKVICDETELVYELGTLDVYQSARYISEIAPNIARVAIVCGSHQFDDGKFWETVAVNRGLEVKVFKKVEEARPWITE